MAYLAPGRSAVVGDFDFDTVRDETSADHGNFGNFPKAPPGDVCTKWSGDGSGMWMKTPGSAMDHGSSLPTCGTRSTSSRGVSFLTLDDVPSCGGTKWARDISASTIDSLSSGYVKWARDVSASTIGAISSPAWSRGNTIDDEYTMLSDDDEDLEGVQRLAPMSPTVTDMPDPSEPSPSSMVRKRSARALRSENNVRARNRLVTRTGLGISEHLGERAMETVLERSAEHMLESVVLREGARPVLETTLHGVGHHGGKLQASAHSVVQRFFENSGERGLTASIAKQAERHHMLTILAMRLSVVVIGMFLVCHMVHSDLHRAHEEKKKSKPSRTSYRMFMLAAVLDGIDFIVHLMVFMDLTFCTIDHHVLHLAETLGLWCAVVGTVALILGELISAPRPHGAAKVVDCTDGALSD